MKTNLSRFSADRKSPEAPRLHEGQEEFPYGSHGLCRAYLCSSRHFPRQASPIHSFTSCTTTVVRLKIAKRAPCRPAPEPQLLAVWTPDSPHSVPGASGVILGRMLPAPDLAVKSGRRRRGGGKAVLTQKLALTRRRPGRMARGVALAFPLSYLQITRVLELPMAAS